MCTRGSLSEMVEKESEADGEVEAAGVGARAANVAAREAAVEEREVIVVIARKANTNLADKVVTSRLNVTSKKSSTRDRCAKPQPR